MRPASTLRRAAAALLLPLLLLALPLHALHAPALARLLNVQAPSNATGRVLSEAFK
jgi:hypothetical protein